VTCRTVRAVAAATPERRERAGLRREQLASDRMKARQKRLIIPTGSSDCKSGSEFWKIATRGPVGRVL
jgi:hypothetical protein